MLGTSVVDLLQYLHDLPDDPSILRVVILSSYSTWVNRITYWDEEALSARAGKFVRSVTKANAPKVGKEDDHAEEADNEYDAEQLNQLHSFCKAVIEALIGDEAQKLKSELTMTHKSVSDLAPHGHPHDQFR